MTERFESRFKGFDKKELFFQCWLTPQADRTMVITHGLAEHSECYHDFALKMNEDKINVYAWDLAGHGRSSGKRGYIPNFNDYELDLRCFIDVIFKELGSDDKKIILFGHSMGGLITLMHLLNVETSRYVAACLSSPALGYSIEVSSIKDWLARFSNKWFPTLTLYNEIEYRDLTHIPEKLAEYENDSFRHDKICAAIYLGMMENFDFVFENAKSIQLPLIFQLAGHDRIVSTTKSKELFQAIASENKKLEVYAESYHEIFNDIEQDLCFKDLKTFLRTLK